MHLAVLFTFFTIIILIILTEMCLTTISLFDKITPKYLNPAKSVTFTSIYNLPAQKNTAWKVPKYGVFSGPYFPVFGLNTEIYLRVQSEYKKIRTRKNSVFGHFSRSETSETLAIKKGMIKLYPINSSKLLRHT